MKGNFAIELILWLSFVVPGLLYTVWRLTNREPVCSQCGTPHMIPLDSPHAPAVVAAPIERPPSVERPWPVILGAVTLAVFLIAMLVFLLWVFR